MPRLRHVADDCHTECGLGICSCERPYWAAASRAFGLRRPDPGEPCALSVAYQAVRNVAAAEALAGENRLATFLLLYDARNPGFSGAGDWPGWISMLTELAQWSDVLFASLSWQELLGKVELDSAVTQRARGKHGLGEIA